MLIQSRPGVRWYGFRDPQQYRNMQWGSGPALKKPTAANYEVEHILEWQLVTGFFDWLSNTHFGGQTFPNPEPLSASRIDFCQYWLKFWDYRFPIGQHTRNAEEHIQHAFPYKNGPYENEFVWLDADINAPAKAEVRSFSNSLPVSWNSLTLTDVEGEVKTGYLRESWTQRPN